ncbi:uncharacterized protein [Littorina saxatilis]|uniref:uncharacterized protein n=1 Tax=Littorina saxatilis TaxID=31220 RepID=UPI0038B47C11
MDFEVRYFENQTCEQMKTRIKSIQKEDHSNYDCFVCCISSHGNKTGVCGADDYTVNISELQEYVFSTQCPSLAGKPKVFFVDACRGGEGQKGHYLAQSGAPARGVVITDKRDFFLSFVTIPDNVAYCNPDSTKGSVYFYHLTRLLERYAKSKTLMHILHKLNEALTEESQGNKLQTAEYQSTLAKELRFYCPVQAMVRALQQELTQAQNRVQVLEREVKRKDDQIKQNDTDSANQLQGEKARHQNIATQLTDSKKTCSALKKDVASYKRQLRELQNKATESANQLQGEKAHHQNIAKQLQDSKNTCSALEKELQGEKTRHQDTAKQLTDCKKTCSALDKELQGEKTRHRDTTKQLQDCKKTCSALEKNVASYQRQLRKLQNKTKTSRRLTRCYVRARKKRKLSQTASDVTPSQWRLGIANSLPARENLHTVLGRYPRVWQGMLALKNDQSYVQMHFVSGSKDLPEQALPRAICNQALPFRISQRMHLEQPNLEGVTKRMKNEKDYTLLLAVPCGVNHLDITDQTKNLTVGFIEYLRSKLVAGIVNVSQPGTNQPAFVVYVFPPCEFSMEVVANHSQGVVEQIHDLAHVIIIITTV